MTTVEPVHSATVAGKPLRFFRTPLDDGRPDLCLGTVSTTSFNASTLGACSGARA